MILGAMSQVEGRKVVLQIGVASDRTIFRHDEQPLIFRPPCCFYCTSVPWYLPDQFAGATVDVDGGFGCLSATIREDPVFTSVKGCIILADCLRLRKWFAYLQRRYMELQ